MGYCKQCGNQTNIADNFCSKCGFKVMDGKKLVLKKTLVNSAFGIFTLLGIFGMLYIAMIYYNPNYFVLPFATMASTEFTRIANQYNPQVDVIAKNITMECVNETEDIKNFNLIGFSLQDCEIQKDKDYLNNNFQYEYDWAATGYFGKGYNMITENISKGDCKSWAITFCSLLRHQNVTCIVRTVKNHALSVVKKDDGTWYPMDVLNGIDGGFGQEMFDGWMV